MAHRLSDLYTSEISRALDALREPGEDVTFEVIPAVKKSGDQIVMFVSMWLHWQGPATLQYTASFAENDGVVVAHQIDQFVALMLRELRNMRFEELMRVNGAAR